MAIDATEREALRDALLRARTRGTRSLQMGGEKVEYQSDADLAAAITDFEARIRRASTARPTSVLKLKGSVIWPTVPPL